MSKIQIEIRDDIPDAIAVECVMHVVRHGKVSQGEHGKMYYCWATVLETPVGKVVVSTRQYRKNDCFVVYSSFARKGRISQSCERISLSPD